MKIGIDVSQIVYGTGVSNYVKNLVINLLQIDDRNCYFLFGGSLRNRETLANFFNQLKLKKEQTKITALSPNLANLVWNHWHIYPVEKITGPLDVYLSSDWAQAPTIKAKKTTIVYDLIPWLYPEKLHQKIITAHQARMKWIEKEVDQVIATSQSTREDLIKTIGISPKKITVCYPGLDHNRFFPQKEEKINQIRKKYQLKKFILALGTREPRKNFSQVISAFEKINYPDLELAIVGKYGWGKEPKQTRNSSIKILGYVPDEDLAPLYSAAEVFIYPSFYEGFGLPIVEAQACGCPVITSQTSSMPEAAGKGAILINPNSNQDLVKAITTITSNSQIRNQLVKKGQENSRQFSWQKCAQKFLTVINQLYLKKERIKVK